MRDSHTMPVVEEVPRRDRVRWVRVCIRRLKRSWWKLKVGVYRVSYHMKNEGEGCSHTWVGAEQEFDLQIDGTRWYQTRVRDDTLQHCIGTTTHLASLHTR